MRKNKLPISAFTIVELMVAVSILSVGMVLIIRSLLTGSSALDLLQDRITAIGILEQKMSDFDEKTVRNGGIKTDSGSEEAALNGKPALYGFDIKTVSSNAAEEDRLNEIRLKLSWHEGGIEREEILETYAKNKTGE